MRLLRSLHSRIVGLFKRSQAESDLAAELQHYIDQQTEHYIAGGLSPDEARRRAVRSAGGIEQIKEDCRDARGTAWLEQTIQDILYGSRTLLKNPLFATMAVLSLALGIGANTAIYSIMDAIMLRALPVQDPGQLIILNWRAKGDPPVVTSHSGNHYDEPGGGTTSPDFPWPVYELVRDNKDAFSTVFAYKSAGQLNLVFQGQAESRDVEFVSGSFFSGLGLLPETGRLIAENDQAAGASQVIVLSYDYWLARFAGDPAIVGQVLRVNDLPFTIAGVTQREFFGVQPGSNPVAYIPIINRPSLARNHGNEQQNMFIDSHFYWVDIIARLRPGVTLQRAQVELAPQFHQFVLSSASTDKERANLPVLWLQEGGSGLDGLRRQYSKPLFVLMTMVAFILAIACANIANLLLARSYARRREMAVRLSLGASRMRIVRQLLTESLLLALPGGILGLGIAAGGIRFLTWLLGGGRENFSLHAELDWRILGFTIALALATGLLFGLAPALAATRVDVTPALKESRASDPRTRGRFSLSLSQLLVVSQISLSLLLVLGAAIFVRTLANLHSVAIGFNQENLLTFTLDASQAGYKAAALNNFYAGLDDRFRTVPGVRAATLADVPLVSGYTSSTRVVLAGLGADAASSRTGLVGVGSGFFETLQLPLVLGRAIDSHDISGAPIVAVVNEVFANKFFPKQNPLGQKFQLGNSQAGPITIVGVAKNARYSSLKGAIPPVAYLPLLQSVFKGPPPPMIFELRTVGDPIALAASVRKIVHNAAPTVPVTGIMTHAERIENTITQERTFADLCTAFALLALAIACVGLYATMAYAVSRRTNEIGIRMALGAQRPGIIWMVLREVLALAAVGLTFGLAAAWSALSSLQSFVFGMKSADPLAILSTTAILTAALVFAGFAPATRASRIDPMHALRHE